MPIRQPNGICTPACSPASISEVAASAATRLAAAREGDRAALAVTAAARARRSAPGAADRPDPGCRPDRFGVVEHALRSAGPGLPLAPVRHHVVERAGPAGPRSGWCARSAGSPGGVRCRCGEFVGEHHVGCGRRANARARRRAICVAARQGAQHRHHRGDARSRRSGTAPRPARDRACTKLPCGAASRTTVPGRDAADQMGGQEALGHGLDGDGDGARARCRCAGRRGQRVGPPPPAAVDQQADADVLPGLVVEGEPPAGLDHQRRRIARSRGGPRRSGRAAHAPTTAGWPA